MDISVIPVIVPAREKSSSEKVESGENIEKTNNRSALPGLHLAVSGPAAAEPWEEATGAAMERIFVVDEAARTGYPAPSGDPLEGKTVCTLYRQEARTRDGRVVTVPADACGKVVSFNRSRRQRPW